MKNCAMLVAALCLVRFCTAQTETAKSMPFCESVKYLLGEQRTAFANVKGKAIDGSLIVESQVVPEGFTNARIEFSKFKADGPSHLYSVAEAEKQVEEVAAKVKACNGFKSFVTKIDGARAILLTGESHADGMVLVTYTKISKGDYLLLLQVMMYT